MRRAVRGRVKHALLAVFLIGGLMAVGGPADAVHDEGFDLQGDVVTTTETYDWTDVLTTATVASAGVAVGDGIPRSSLPGNFIVAGFEPDYTEPDPTAYATGTKDTLPINKAGAGDWQCKSSNNIGSKFNLVNAYAAAWRVTTDSVDSDIDDLIVYFGSEIASPNGDRNVGMWLLQDRNVDCQSTGGNTDWTGHHVDGDIFVVSAFTNGGTKANITVYEWVDETGAPNDDVGGSLQLRFNSADNALDDAACDGAKLGDQTPPDSACAIENHAEISPPWNHPDADGGALNVNEFVEGGVNLGALDLDKCFSTAVFNSRSSQETGSTLHDYARMQFETCGNLTVKKYIDVNMSGTNDSGDVTTGTAVSSWSMSVAGPSSTSTVCSGTTNSNGELVCTTGSLQNLQPGTYTVTETQKTGFFNTDPGTGNPNTTFNPTTPTVTKNINVGLGANQTAELGNTCYVDKTFRITEVPSNVGTIKVDYEYFGPTRATTQTATIDLVTSGTVAEATVADILNQKDSITWDWYLASDPGTKIRGATNESLSGAGWPSCAKTNPDDFDNTTVRGSKFKDINGDGDQDSNEPGLGGVVFELRQGSSTTGTVITTATSSSTTGSVGDYEFPIQVPPGTYTVTEQVPSGWAQTTPTAGTGHTFTVVLNQATAVIPAFGNTPLSRIHVQFESLGKLPGTNTDATRATSISCVDSFDSDVGHTTATADNDLTTDNVQVKQSEVVCTITYEDP